MLELISRLEKSRSQSRDLDADIAIACNIIVERQWWSINYLTCDMVACYTSSVDAAIGLAEKMLPGHGRLTGKGRTRPDEPLYGAQIFDVEFAPALTPQNLIGEAEHGVEAIALVIAVLRAIESTRSSNGGE